MEFELKLKILVSLLETRGNLITCLYQIVHITLVPVVADRPLVSSKVKTEFEILIQIASRGNSMIKIS